MAIVLITNAYSARNRGDAAIILGMVTCLRRTGRIRDADITVSTVDHPEDAKRYPVRTIDSFHSLKNRLTGFSAANLAYFLAVLLPLSVLWAVARRSIGIELPVPSRLRALMRQYAAADVVVAAGGGYLYTTSRYRGNVVLLVNLHSFMIATLLGKPVVLFAQSVGPFAGRWQERLVLRALSRVEHVQVREEVSRKLLEESTPRIRIHRVADAAFVLESEETALDVERFAAGRILVGVTVRDWFRARDRQLQYEQTMAGFARWLIDERDAAVVFVPQVTYLRGGDDDRITSRRVAAAVERPPGILTVEEDMSAAQVKGLCGRMDLFVGTRMHSNIFAVSEGVPSLAVAYQHKTIGIMAMLGLDRYVVRIEALTCERLRNTFDEILARRCDIENHLRLVVPKIREDALLGGALVLDVLSATRSRSPSSGADS